MPMYALATVPLINQLHGTVDQVWYADDACACGSIQDLLIWWNQLCIKGPAFGYFVNVPKTWLVSKERFHSIATTLFSDTDVQITSVGCSYLWGCHWFKCLCPGICEGQGCWLVSRDYTTCQVRTSSAACCLFRSHSWLVKPLALPLSHYSKHIRGFTTS